MHHKALFIPLALCITLLAVACSAADIPLSGQQDGDYEAAEYLIAKTITVPPGKRLRFAPGSIIRFKKFAGITVNGTLECNGSVTSPVVFTSELNRPVAEKGVGASVAPKAFDWQGIEADSGARVSLSFCRITYSGCGVLVKPGFMAIRLGSVVFADNGRAHVDTAGTALDVPDNKPFSYAAQAPVVVPVNALSTPPQMPSVADGAKPKVGGWKLPVRVGLGVVGVAGVVVWVVAQPQIDEFKTKYLIAADSQLAEKYRNDYHTIIAVRNCGIAAGIVGLSGITVTFFF